MDTVILDEYGDMINQLATRQEHTVSPLMIAFFMAAYDHDPQFKAVIDDFATGFKSAVKSAMDELEAD